MKSGDTPIDNYYELAIANTPQPKQVNIGDSAVQYTIEAVANGVDLVLSSAFEECREFDGWTLAGVELPYAVSMPSPKLNIADKSSQLNVGAYNPKRYQREFGEAVKITMNIDEEKTRELLSTFQTIRGSEFTIVTPLNYNLFTHLYPTNTSFQCILDNSAISMKFAGNRDVTVSFYIKLLAVN